MADPGVEAESSTLVRVRDVVRDYPLGERLFFSKRAGVNRAVDHVSFSIDVGSTFGLAGETGSGKTTTGRMVAGLETVSAGSIIVDGADLATLRRGALREHRRTVQMVFQDPYASLNPRMSVGDLICEPLQVHHVGTAAERRRRVVELLEMVHLDRESAARFPHEFSGGQRQRVSIARGLALSPKLLVLDEPVSALDLSVRAQITNLLIELQRATGITYLIISHDLLGLRHMADRVGVLYRGKLVELGPSLEVYARPQHHYTRQLIDAVPALGLRRSTAGVEDSQAPGSRTATGMGCPFVPHCPAAQDLCTQDDPPLSVASDVHAVACHFPLTNDTTSNPRVAAHPITAAKEAP